MTRKFFAVGVALSTLVGCVAPIQQSGEKISDSVKELNEQSDPAVLFANANKTGTTGYQEGYFGSGDNRLHFVEAGQGPLVILYHGFPSFWYSWFDQMEVLKKQYRVVAVDGLGSGLSAKPQEVEPYKLSALSKQLDDLARHLGGDEKFVLIGHDWGSVLALSYAQAYPERLSKVIGMNAPPLNMFLRYLAKSPEQQSRSSYMTRIKDTTIEQIRATDGGKRLAQMGYGNLARRGDLSEDEVALFRGAMSDPKTAFAMMNWYRANIPAWDQITEDDMWPSPNASLDVPALVIWGEKDRVAVPELVSKLADSSPSLKFVNLPEVNHWTSMEQPERANRVILDFLKQKGG
ncbi:MAG: alpha/beta hydrolase [Parasphingorhabdus sp.]